MRHCSKGQLDRHNIFYIIGLDANKRINRLAEGWINEAQEQYEKTGEKQRLFGEVLYGARSWDKERRIIVKAKLGWLGKNPRYVVTNLEGNPQQLYERIYCGRGEMQNRSKEQQLDLS